MDKSIFLHILDLDPGELKMSLALAVHLLHADGIAEIEEWNVLTLLPALLDVIKEDTPDNLKKDWKKKLSIANKALSADYKTREITTHQIKKGITSPGGRKACLLLLFLLANSDRDIHPKELQFIMEKIAKTWDYSKEDIISMITGAGDEIPGSSTIISLLKKY